MGLSPQGTVLSVACTQPRGHLEELLTGLRTSKVLTCLGIFILVLSVSAKPNAAFQSPAEELRLQLELGRVAGWCQGS